MIRRDAIIHARALLRHLDAAGSVPGWRAALTTLIRTAETVERAQRRRLRATSPDQRRAVASQAAKARWAAMSAEERSAEMRRRRRGRKKSTPPAEIC